MGSPQSKHGRGGKWGGMGRRWRRSTLLTRGPDCKLCFPSLLSQHFLKPNFYQICLVFQTAIAAAGRASNFTSFSDKFNLKKKNQTLANKDPERDLSDNH